MTYDEQVAALMRGAFPNEDTFSVAARAEAARRWEQRRWLNDRVRESSEACTAAWPADARRACGPAMTYALDAPGAEQRPERMAETPSIEARAASSVTVERERRRAAPVGAERGQGTSHFQRWVSPREWEVKSAGKCATITCQP